jgi:hypothetical protein
MKPRRYMTLPGVEVVIRLTPAQLRDHLLALAEAALWNMANSEEPGTPQHRDQETFARELKRCAQAVDEQCKLNWKDA